MSEPLLFIAFCVVVELLGVYVGYMEGVERTERKYRR